MQPTLAHDATRLLGAVILLSAMPAVSAVWGNSFPPTVGVAAMAVSLVGASLVGALAYGWCRRAVVAASHPAYCQHCQAYYAAAVEAGKRTLAAEGAKLAAENDALDDRERAMDAEDRTIDAIVRGAALARQGAAEEAERLLGGTLTDEQRERLEALKRPDSELANRLLSEFRAVPA